MTLMNGNSAYASFSFRGGNMELLSCPDANTLCMLPIVEGQLEPRGNHPVMPWSVHTP